MAQVGEGLEDQVDREWFVGTASEFDEARRKIVTIGENEIVIFQYRGRVYAFDNWCVHMGGPVGEGLLIGKVEAVVTPGKQVTGHRFSETEMHLVCPWHGYEYDINTGEFAGDRTLKLRQYETTRRGDNVYVIA